MLTSVVSRGCARRSRDPLHGISTATPASASRSDGLVGRVVTEGGRPRSPAPDRRGSHRWTEMGRGGPCSSPDLNDPATSPPCTSICPVSAGPHSPDSARARHSPGPTGLHGLSRYTNTPSTLSAPVLRVSKRVCLCALHTVQQPALSSRHRSQMNEPHTGLVVTAPPQLPAARQT